MDNAYPRRASGGIRAAILVSLCWVTSVPAQETQHYAYSARGELRSVARSGGTNDGFKTAYTLDNAANRTRVVARDVRVWLGAGMSIKSQDLRFQLVMQTDGNLVLYGPTGALWWTSSYGPDRSPQEEPGAGPQPPSGRRVRLQVAGCRGRRPMTRSGYLTLAQIADMDPAVLATEWARRYGAPAPNISPDLVRLGQAYRFQEQRHGGVSRTSKTVMRRAAVASDQPHKPTAIIRKLTPGTRLVRDWHGVGRTVTVLEDGFAYDGRPWPSLSAIAKAVTGAHWNGPRFFGLTERRK